MYINYENYVAIIGDIIESKVKKDRNDIQQKLKKVLNDINLKYSNDIASKFKITLGDEFQGLLKSKNNILKIILEIEIQLAPVKIRFGIGIGEINTDINFNDSSEIDGPAYHRARKMINDIEIKKSQYTEPHFDIMLCSNEKNIEIDKLINSIFSVCTALKSKWTDRQKEIIYTYISNGENQYKAAEILGITQSSVNKALNNAKFYTFISALDTVSNFLSINGVYNYD